ncbi:MAG: dTDP-4-dehydrorhamnose 3,5-epimerase family protein [Bacteroidales bacterium]|jgi:dTDP-4-dehydrorhamnose 3,5-epimerase
MKNMSYKDFIIEKSRILPDIIIIKPAISWDIRGNIFTSYNQDFYDDALPKKLIFKHDKFAQSRFNVLRGLHGDHKTWKLVSCVFGELFEVVVDVQPNSLTYQKWDAFILSSTKYQQILIPPGYVNGYYVQSDCAVFHYKLAYDGEYIDANEQMTFRWDDPQFNIAWPCKEPVLQERDK